MSKPVNWGKVKDENDGRGENVKFENLAWLAGWIKIFNQVTQENGNCT